MALFNPTCCTSGSWDIWQEGCARELGNNVFIESQKSWLEEAFGGLESKSFPALYLVNHGFVQLSLENLQEQILCHLSGQPVPLLPRILFNYVCPVWTIQAVVCDVCHLLHSLLLPRRVWVCHHSSCSLSNCRLLLDCLLASSLPH